MESLNYKEFVLLNKVVKRAMKSIYRSDYRKTGGPPSWIINAENEVTLIMNKLKPGLKGELK